MNIIREFFIESSLEKELGGKFEYSGEYIERKGITPKKYTSDCGDEWAVLEDADYYHYTVEHIFSSFHDSPSSFSDDYFIEYLKMDPRVIEELIDHAVKDEHDSSTPSGIMSSYYKIFGKRETTVEYEKLVKEENEAFENGASDEELNEIRGEIDSLLFYFDQEVLEILYNRWHRLFSNKKTFIEALRLSYCDVDEYLRDSEVVDLRKLARDIVDDGNENYFLSPFSEVYRLESFYAFKISEGE